MGEKVMSGQRQGRGLWFALFLTCGLLVFVVFSHYLPLSSGSVDVIGRIVVALAFLTAAQLSRRSERFRETSPVWLAFFVALVAISVDYYLGLSKWLLPALSIEPESPAGWAIDKLESSVLGIVIVLVLTRASGQRLTSLYLRRGNFWLGLAVGLTAFVVMIVTVIQASKGLFNGKDLSWGRILPWTPWVLIFVLANAFNEELLFRGLFFGRLQPFIRPFAINLLTAIPFTLMHTGVSYSTDILLFIAILFPLSLMWGGLAQKTDSLWGSILFHAAMDIPIAVGLFSNLG